MRRLTSRPEASTEMRACTSATRFTTRRHPARRPSVSLTTGSPTLEAARDRPDDGPDGHRPADHRVELDDDKAGAVVEDLDPGVDGHDAHRHRYATAGRLTSLKVDRGPEVVLSTRRPNPPARGSGWNGRHRGRSGSSRPTTCRSTRWARCPRTAGRSTTRQARVQQRCKRDGPELEGPVVDDEPKNPGHRPEGRSGRLGWGCWPRPPTGVPRRRRGASGVGGAGVGTGGSPVRECRRPARGGARRGGRGGRRRGSVRGGGGAGSRPVPSAPAATATHEATKPRIVDGRSDRGPDRRRKRPPSVGGCSRARRARASCSSPRLRTMRARSTS
jgi:hypothetical protein